MCSHHAYGRVGYIGGQQVPVRFSPFTGYWCGHRCNTVSSFGPTQFNGDVRKLERVQGRGHKFQLGRFKADILLYQEGSATLEWRGGGMSILWCLQGSLTKPLTLSLLMIVLPRAAGWTWMTSHPFLPTGISEMLWVTPEFQVKPVEKEEYRNWKLWKKTKSGREQNSCLSFPLSGPLLLSPCVGHGKLADRGEQADRNQPLLQRNSDSPQKSQSCAVDVAWVLGGVKSDSIDNVSRSFHERGLSYRCRALLHWGIVSSAWLSNRTVL